MKLLHIDSSITGANSASRQLSAALVAALKAAIPNLEVIRRDLDANPIPHLDSKRLPTVRPANAPAGAVGIADEGGSDVLDEFLGADILVIGAPMYKLWHPKPTQGMDRPHRDCRQDFQLHGGRANRAGRRQACNRGLIARRPLRTGNAIRG